VFTTGQGAGLGLSLSYDIIKAQGGELRVENKEGEGAEFIINLPIKFLYPFYGGRVLAGLFHVSVFAEVFENPGPA